MSTPKRLMQEQEVACDNSCEILNNYEDYTH